MCRGGIGVCCKWPIRIRDRAACGAAASVFLRSSHCRGAIWASCAGKAPVKPRKSNSDATATRPDGVRNAPAGRGAGVKGRRTARGSIQQDRSEPIPLGKGFGARAGGAQKRRWKSFPARGGGLRNGQTQTLHLFASLSGNGCPFSVTPAQAGVSGGHMIRSERSPHSGLLSSISRIFHARFHALPSRATA